MSTTLHYTTPTTTTTTILHLHYTPLHHYTTPHHTTLNYTTLHYPTPHSFTLHYIASHYITLHYTHYTTTHATATTLILQLHYATTTTTAALHHTSSCGWGGRPRDHCNHCSHSKKHSSNRLSVHQWICSAIRDSQLPISPIGFLFLKLPPPPCAVLLVKRCLRIWQIWMPKWILIFLLVDVRLKLSSNQNWFSTFIDTNRYWNISEDFQPNFVHWYSP